MAAITNFSDSVSTAFISVEKELVVKIGEDFTKLTGYQKEDVINKDISDVFNNLLRINYTIHDIENNKTSDGVYLFTKNFESVEVIISVNEATDLQEKRYILTETLNSRIENKFLEQLIHDNVIGVAIHSIPELLLLKTNQKYLDFLDFPYNEIKNSIGKTFRERVYGFEGSKVEKLFEKIIQTEKSYYPVEIEFEHFKRGVTYWDSSLVSISVEGKAKYIVETVSEVTEKVLARKKIEEQSRIIEQQNELMRMQADLLNLSNEAIFAWNADGAIVYWNKGAEKTYGYSSEEAIGCFSHVLLKSEHPKGIDHIKSELDMYGSWNGEIEHICKDGKKIVDETSIQKILNEAGQQIALETSRNITERKRIERDILIKNKQLESIIENISDGLIVSDKNGSFQIINSAARKMINQLDTAVKAGEIEKENIFTDMDGKHVEYDNFPLFRALSGEITNNLPLFRATSVEITNNFTIVMKHPNDYEQILEVNATPIYDDENNLVSVLTCLHDVSELIRVQQEIKNKQEHLIKIEKERNEDLTKLIEMKDEFLALISHELKTPLTVINSAIQTMEMVCKDELSDKAKGYINKIQQNSYRQLKLINNILDNTRLDAGHFKINLKDIDIVLLTKSIIEATEIYAEQKGIKLLFISPLDEMVIRIDEEHYEKILLNLLSNAIKFTPKGKSITVKLSQRAVKGKDKVIIHVIDKGVGIPSDKKDLIFEKFGQVDTSLSRQAEGTGLGLSIVRMLVEMHEGEITLESKVGVGSTFTIILPKKSGNYSIEKEKTEKFKSNLMNAATIEFSDVYLK